MIFDANTSYPSTLQYRVFNLSHIRCVKAFILSLDKKILFCFIKCLQFKAGLHGHGLGIRLNGKGCGDDIHVFNETKLVVATGTGGGRGGMCRV